MLFQDEETKVKVTRFLVALVGKEPTGQYRRLRRLRFDAWVGRSPGGGPGDTFQYCLENPTDRGAWSATVYGVTKSLTQPKQLSNTQRWQEYK